MIFVYKEWDKFCAELKKKDIVSIPANEVLKQQKKFLVLKHDIESCVHKAYKIAEIEYRYGHRGSYYLHAYLLDNPRNIAMLKKMQDMGHEISYHYDVMDSNKGDIAEAINEFEKNKKKFETLNFKIRTVCQHGNPMIKREGYTSNRDFFRNLKVRELYPDIADIMVNYKELFDVDYSYYSDAGRRFQLVFDPISNDIVKSDEKNIPYESLEQLLENLHTEAIISTHPHRWTSSRFEYVAKAQVFKLIKFVVKELTKITLFQNIINKYYYLARKL